MYLSNFIEGLIGKLKLICEWYDITNLFFEFKELSAGVNRASRAYNLKPVSRHDFEDVADDEYDAAVKGNHNPDIFLKYWLNSKNIIQKNLNISKLLSTLNTDGLVDVLRRQEIESIKMMVYIFLGFVCCFLPTLLLIAVRHNFHRTYLISRAINKKSNFK